VKTGRRRDDHVLAGHRHRAQVVGVHPGRRKLVGLAAVAAEPEPFGGGEQHDACLFGMGQHLVDVDLDVDRGCPRRAAVARAGDAAHVDVDVDGPVGRHRDRPRVGGIAPRLVPGLAPLDALERLEGDESIAGQA
jgi:hypothetical protein